MIRDSKLEKYINRIIDPEDPLLYALNRETHVKVMHPRMISGHLQGQVLQMISKMIRPVSVLEIGTFTGYSAICLSKGLPQNGHLHTIEKNDEILEIAERYFIKAGIRDKVTIHTGDALNIIPSLDMTFDLIFIDGEKSEYLNYYHCIFEKVISGGFILADNILWNGKVVEEIEQGDHFTKGIIDFNEYIRTDTRIEKTILPIRDGMMLMQKK